MSLFKKICFQWFVSTLMLCSSTNFGQKIDFDKLSKQIEQNIENNEYEASIRALHEVIYDPTSTNFEKYTAYYLKHKTYKSFNNYSEATNDLETALEFGIKTPKKEHIQAKHKIDLTLIACEQLNYPLVIEQFNRITPENVKLLNTTDTALYLYLKAVTLVEDKNKDYVQALYLLDQSIEVLKKEYPAYLPLILKEKAKVFAYFKDDKNVLKTYDEGMTYAIEHNNNFYIVELYRFLFEYYKSTGQNKESMQVSKLIIVAVSKYNSNIESSKLLKLEKKLLTQHKEATHKKNKQEIQMLTTILSVVFITILIVFYSYKRSKTKRIKITNEHSNLKSALNVQISNKSTEEKSIENTQVNEGLTTTKLLTERQESIVALVKEGKKNKEIAKALFISENTVKYHLKIIYSVLNIEGRHEL